jgi:hypothetical protein
MGPTPERARETKKVERAIVVQLLSEDRCECWSRAELARALPGCDGEALEGMLARLCRAGVLSAEGSSVRVARAVRRLDELELIAI